MSDSLKIAFRAIIACLLWSSAFAGVKIGLQYLPPFMLAGVRFLLSGLMLLPFCGSLKKYFAEVRSNLTIVITVSLTQTFVMYAFYFSGINMIPASVAAIVVGSSPLLTAVITHIVQKNDKLNRKKLVTIVVGIMGIVFVVAGRQTLEEVGIMDMIGISLLLLSMVLSAFSSVLVSDRTSGINPVVLNSSQLAIGGILLIFLSLGFEGVPSVPSGGEFYLALAWLSFLSAAAFTIWFKLLRIKHVRVSELEMWKFMVPVFGAVFSWLILPDESPSVISITGMIIIAASILLYNLPGAWGKKSGKN